MGLQSIILVFMAFLAVGLDLYAIAFLKPTNEAAKKRNRIILIIVGVLVGVLAVVFVVFTPPPGHKYHEKLLEGFSRDLLEQKRQISDDFDFTWYQDPTNTLSKEEKGAQMQGTTRRHAGFLQQVISQFKGEIYYLQGIFADSRKDQSRFKESLDIANRVEVEVVQPLRKATPKTDFNLLQVDIITALEKLRLEVHDSKSENLGRNHKQIDLSKK